MDNLLDIQSLETVFQTRDGTVHAVNGISLSIKEAKPLAL